jgi:ABC-2 type transport system ATP-binding protein
MIEARRLTKSFRGRPAVVDVSFEVGAGEIVGLLGTNGAGKSTTLRLLAGSLRPDRGTTSIAGHDMATARRQAQACLGYLPEAAAGFANLTVLELLTFAAESRGYWGAKRRAAIARAIEALDLGPAMAIALERLSKGWRQRAWLSQRSCMTRSVLILDEPTDGLDPNRKRICAASAGGARLRPSSCPRISSRRPSSCDRFIVISGGAVVADRPRGARTATAGLAGAFPADRRSNRASTRQAGAQTAPQDAVNGGLAEIWSVFPA